MTYSWEDHMRETASQWEINRERFGADRLDNEPSLTFSRIIVSPFRTNVMDLIGRTDLATITGLPVRVERGYRDGFKVIVTENKKDVVKVDTQDNLSASAVLNGLEVGIWSY
jgi:phage terminase Nu1 subunit (DNA packaging protein)